MKLSELNWNDIVTKVIIAAIPVVFGYFTIQAKSERNDMDERLDRLAGKVERLARTDSLRDTLQGKAIRRLEGKARRGVRFAATDTVEVKRPSRWKLWWHSLFPKKEVQK